MMQLDFTLIDKYGFDNIINGILDLGFSYSTFHHTPLEDFTNTKVYDISFAMISSNNKMSRNIPVIIILENKDNAHRLKRYLDLNIFI